MTEPKYDMRHGGPYDRGSADAYYKRIFYPHYYANNVDAFTVIEIDDPDSPEFDAYRAGYNEQTGEKDWG